MPSRVLVTGAAGFIGSHLVDRLPAVLAAVDYTEQAPDAFEIIDLRGSASTPLRRLIELLASAVGVDVQLDVKPRQAGDVLRTHADVGKAHKLLGYAPSVGVEEGIPRFVDWMRTNT